MPPRPPMHRAAEPDFPQNLLLSGAARLEISVNAQQLAQLQKYQALLQSWGRKINLTALHDASDIVVRHFLDSLALLRELPSAAELAAEKLSSTLVDVGSGAGFPGVICALFRPDLRVTLVERIGKKAAFLLALRRELGLTYEVEAESAERLGRNFSIIVSRAAMSFADWLHLGASLAEPAGWVFAMTSSNEPKLSEGILPELRLDCETAYDVGAGLHLIRRYRRSRR